MALALMTLTTFIEFFSMFRAAISDLPRPVAVTTTPSSISISGSIEIFSSLEKSLKLISKPLYPTRLQIKVPEVIFVSMEKLPSRPVTAQLSDTPLSNIVTPIISSPVEASTTFPRMVPAIRTEDCNRTAIVSRNTFVFIPFVFGGKGISGLFQPYYSQYVFILSCRYVSVTSQKNPGRPQGMTGIRWLLTVAFTSSGTRWQP